MSADKPNSVCSPEGEEAVICLMRPTRSASSMRVERAALLPLSADGVQRNAEPVWSCTRWGLSCPDGDIVTVGIPSGTIPIAQNAVVSYTTFSPFLPVPKNRNQGMCFFCDTFRSHRILPVRPSISRGTLPGGVRTFLPPPVAGSDCLAVHPCCE